MNKHEDIIQKAVEQLEQMLNGKIDRLDEQEKNQCMESFQKVKPLVEISMVAGMMMQYTKLQSLAIREDHEGLKQHMSYLFRKSKEAKSKFEEMYPNAETEHKNHDR